MEKTIITSTNEGMKLLGITVIGDIKNAVHDALYSRIQLVPEYTDHTTLEECLTALIFWKNQLKIEKNKNLTLKQEYEKLAAGVAAKDALLKVIVRTLLSSRAPLVENI